MGMTSRKVASWIGLAALPGCGEPSPPFPVAPRPAPPGAVTAAKPVPTPDPEAEQERAEAKLREASKRVMEAGRKKWKAGCTIEAATPCLEDPSGLAFLVRHKDSLYSCFVEGPWPSDFEVEDRYYWRTEPGDLLAARWASRFQGDGDYRVKSARKVLDPPSLDAVVIHRTTAARYRFRMLNFYPRGYPSFDMTPLD